MTRFNAKGEFNVPVGNVDFNTNVKNALDDYFTYVQNIDIKISSLDFEEFLEKIEHKKDDFLYLNL